MATESTQRHERCYTSKTLDFFSTCLHRTGSLRGRSVFQISCSKVEMVRVFPTPSLTIPRSSASSTCSRCDRSSANAPQMNTGKTVLRTMELQASAVWMEARSWAISSTPLLISLTCGRLSETMDWMKSLVADRNNSEECRRGASIGSASGGCAKPEEEYPWMGAESG